MAKAKQLSGPRSHVSSVSATPAAPSGAVAKSRQSLAISVRPKARRPIAHKIRFDISRDKQALLIRFPEVQRHIIWRLRLLTVQTAINLINRGMSLRMAAEALQMSPSQLCVSLQDYRRAGPDGLRPRQHRPHGKAVEGCTLTLRMS